MVTYWDMLHRFAYNSIMYLKLFSENVYEIVSTCLLVIVWYIRHIYNAYR